MTCLASRILSIVLHHACLLSKGQLELSFAWAAEGEVDAFISSICLAGRLTTVEQAVTECVDW